MSTGSTRPRVPEGLRALMKHFTMEVLKENPIDIYDYAENYFCARLFEKDKYVVNDFEQYFKKYNFSHLKSSQHFRFTVPSIISQDLTNLIKDFIKAVLKEQPLNLCEFGVEYFRHLKNSTTIKRKMESSELNYMAYENYFINKHRLFYLQNVICSCGRTLKNSYLHTNSLNANESNPNKRSEPPIKTKRMLDIDEGVATDSNRYLNAVYNIQKYFRIYLLRKNSTIKSNVNERCEADNIMNVMPTQLESIPNEVEKVSQENPNTNKIEKDKENCYAESHRAGSQNKETNIINGKKVSLLF